LRRQPQLSQQRANRRQAQDNTELLLDQRPYDRSRPQSEIQAVLARITAIDPAKNLPFLRWAQTTGTPRRKRRGKRLHPQARLFGRCYPPIDCCAAETKGRDNRGWSFTVAHPLDSHPPYGFQRSMIKHPSVALHDPMLAY
jgi:hypothetical protein